MRWSARLIYCSSIWCFSFDPISSNRLVIPSTLDPGCETPSFLGLFNYKITESRKGYFHELAFEFWICISNFLETKRSCSPNAMIIMHENSKLFRFVEPSGANLWSVLHPTAQTLLPTGLKPLHHSIFLEKIIRVHVRCPEVEYNHDLLTGLPFSYWIVWNLPNSYQYYAFLGTVVKISRRFPSFSV